MVLKKRCDFCLKIKPDNLQTDEKVLNREFKDVLITISGIEIGSENLSNILTCCECAISILQAEPTVLKVRNLLTKILKSKAKKKGISDTGNVSLLEQSSVIDSDGAQKEVDIEEKKLPAKIKSRRKTIATTKLVDSLINEVLDEIPVASSTMTMNESIIEKNPKAKGTENKKAKQSPAKAKTEKNKTKANNTKEPESNGKTEDETTKFVQPKTLKQKILEGAEITTAKTTPKKDESLKLGKSPQKRPVSYSSKDSNEAANTFKKFKDTTDGKDDQNADVTESQGSLNGDIDRECLECGKVFRSMDKYERHVLAQKCRLANYNCKHPDCSRRFFKLEKMHEHLQKKHPEIQDIDMD